jgi:hypothetical protein
VGRDYQPHFIGSLGQSGFRHSDMSVVDWVKRSGEDGDVHEKRLKVKG